MWRPAPPPAIAKCCRWLSPVAGFGVIASAVVQHLTGLVDAKMTITFEIEAKIPAGAPDNVARTVTENWRTLKFENSGFEES